MSWKPPFCKCDYDHHIRCEYCYFKEYIKKQNEVNASILEALTKLLEILRVNK